MKVQAAVLTHLRTPWTIMELDLEPPRSGEVLIRTAFAGLCYSDEHLRFGDVATLPIVGGHEGAGVVEAVGAGVTDLVPGDHVILSFVPVCGRCRWCASGMSNLCVGTANLGTGRMVDGTVRFHGSGEDLRDIGAFTSLGTFANYTVVSQNSCIRIDEDVPLHVAALISCGVLTGWGAAVHSAQVAPGDTVIVYGTGGIGINAVQGARLAGASRIIAVDPVVGKHEIARLVGATDTVASADEAAELARDIDPLAGGASAAIVATATLRADTVRAAFDAVGKAGVVVIAGMSDDPAEVNVNIPGTMLAGSQKRIQGTFFGSCNPFVDMPKLVRLYQEGHLYLDELISARYELARIDTGYDDLRGGRNLRGLIEHTH